ncbi:excisionase family protein [Serratia proteamaculans]|nr:excisionase family protein [Serratia proteamaculans]
MLGRVYKHFSPQGKSKNSECLYNIKAINLLIVP